MKKITLMLFTGITMYSTVHSQTTTRLVSTSAAVNPPTTVQLANQLLMSSQRQTQTQSVQAIFPNFGWQNKPALPGGRWATGPVFSKNCVAGTDTGFIYLIAGYDASFANTALNTVYNTATGTYRTLAPIPAVRGQVAPIKVGTKIYVIGGYGATSFSPVVTNSIYDIATNTWSVGAPMPIAVGDYASGVYKDSLIYFVGGYSGSADVNTVEIYNTFSNTWAAGTVKPGTAVAGCRMGISGNKIVFVGGYSQTLATELSDSYIGVINAATPTAITWTALPAYPGGTVGRLAGGVAFENTGSVYFGGGDPTGQGIQVLNSIYAYNTTTSTWDSGPNMPSVGVSNIVTLAGIVNNDSLYLVTMGGYDGSVITTNHVWLNLGHAAPLPVAQADVSICNGSSTTLTAFNALTYSWSPATNLSSTTTASTIANPTSTITYSVTMTKAYGCPIVDPVTVTVNPLPTVVANSTASTVCAGSPVTLSGSGATSYTWTGGVTNAVAFNPVSTNTYTVTGTDANGCTNTAMTTVTVNALPTVVANSTAAAVCAGSPVTLSGSGATNYSWTGGVTDAVAFNPVSTNTYTVTGTDANGCTNTAMTTVTVNALPTVVANSTAAAVCAGSPVTLSGSGATNYSWTGGVTDAVAFNPVSTNTYTVTGTDANGCTNTDMTTVTVNALPTVVANSTAAAVCAGSPVTLSGSGATNYSWTGGVTDAVAFNPASTNTYTVTGTDGNGCTNTDMTTVIVNALPVVALGADVIQCSGTAMFDAGNAGSTYLWSDGSTTQTITVSTSGTYSVAVTDANGCANSDTVMVTINANPTVTLGNDIVQCGGTATLDAGNPGSTYLWSNAATTQTITVSTSGTYYVTATLPGGCFASDTILVTINTLPTVTGTAAFTTVCVDDASVALTGSPVGGTWSGTGVTGSSFSPVGAGIGQQTITYTYTDANGCTGFTTIDMQVNACVGVVENASANGINIYPNPANGSTTITGDFSKSGVVSINLFNVLGEKIMTIENDATIGVYSKTIDLSNLSKGIYYLQITENGNVTSTRKIVKQ